MGAESAQQWRCIVGEQQILPEKFNEAGNKN